METATMTPEWLRKRDAMLREYVPDEHARDFIYDISRITELWDDLTDKDKPIPQTTIDNAMMAALVSLPLNPFFRQHSEYLTPLVLQAINAWQDANVLAKGTRSQRMLAYTLRHCDTQLYIAVVFLTQGFDKMREASSELWSLTVAEDDGDAWMAGDNL